MEYAIYPLFSRRQHYEFSLDCKNITVVTFFEIKLCTIISEAAIITAATGHDQGRGRGRGQGRGRGRGQVEGVGVGWRHCKSIITSKRSRGV
jgi:hypothetical protein